MLHEYKTATNMTEQFAALAAIAQNPGKNRDHVLADFYNKWQHDYLVSFLLCISLFSGMIFMMKIVISCEMCYFIFLTLLVLVGHICSMKLFRILKEI